jgi:hypothetical protein
MNDLQRKLAALFHMFRDKPHMLADYFEKYDALNDNFMSMILNSESLDKIADKMENDEDIEKPYFTNIEDMQIYYNSLFEADRTTKRTNIHPVLGASTNEEALRKQLADAVEADDFEKAVKIRDYMLKLGYNHKLNTKK